MFWSPGADGTFQWPPPARSRQCLQWHESCFHSSVLQLRFGETCCKEKEYKLEDFCCHKICFSDKVCIVYSVYFVSWLCHKKIILTFRERSSSAASFTLTLDAKNMIHDGRCFALGKPRFNWCVGVELLGAGENPCQPNYHKSCSFNVIQECIRKYSKVTQVTQLSAEAREGQWVVDMHCQQLRGICYYVAKN